MENRMEELDAYRYGTLTKSVVVLYSMLDYICIQTPVHVRRNAWSSRDGVIRLFSCGGSGPSPGLTNTITDISSKLLYDWNYIII